MKNTFALIAFTLAVLLSGFQSQAQLGTVATAQFSGTGGTIGIIDRSLRLAFAYNPTNTTSIFTQFTFHTNDVGSTFSITALSDPHFVAFTSHATNGILEPVAELFSVGNGAGNQSGSVSESSFFTSFPYGSKGVDLVGYQIQRIDLTLNSLVFNSPGSNPNGDGNWTDFNFNVTLSFIGLVPEPSAAAILGSGLLVLLFRKRSRALTGGASVPAEPLK